MLLWFLRSLLYIYFDNIADGKMFPSRGDLHVAPFQDEALYMEQINKVNFWYQDYFHGVNLSSLRDAAMKEYFRQPIVSRNSQSPLLVGHSKCQIPI